MTNKFFLKSKTLIGAIVLFVSMMFGFTPDEQSQLNQNLVQIVDQAASAGTSIQEVKNVVHAVIDNPTQENTDSMTNLLTDKFNNLLEIIGLVLVTWGRFSAQTNLTLK